MNASLDYKELELPQGGNSLVEDQHFCDKKKKKQRFQKIKTKYKNFNEQKKLVFKLVVLLILREMEKENGSLEALEKDPILQ